MNSTRSINITHLLQYQTLYALDQTRVNDINKEGNRGTVCWWMLPLYAFIYYGLQDLRHAWIICVRLIDQYVQNKVEIFSYQSIHLADIIGPYFIYIRSKQKENSKGKNTETPLYAGVSKGLVPCTAFFSGYYGALL